jgi:hypothetical protein
MKLFSVWNAQEEKEKVGDKQVEKQTENCSNYAARKVIFSGFVFHVLGLNLSGFLVLVHLTERRLGQADVSS